MSKQSFKRFADYEVGNFVILKSGRMGMIDWRRSNGFTMPSSYIIKFGPEGPKMRATNSMILRKATPEEIELSYPGVGYKP